MLTARPKDASPLALRSPLRIEGTFGDPKIRPEMGATALRLGAAALLATIAAPAAALLALIDLGELDADHAVCSESLQQLRGKPSKAPKRQRDESDAKSSTETAPDGR